MTQVVSSDFKLGIIAGGQLAKMLIQAASQWDVQIHILDGAPNGPAAPLSHSFTKGHFANYDDVYAFGQTVDMLTFEIEHVNVEALRKLKAEGKQIFPDPEVLATIQDKGKQKEFYQQHQLKTAPFQVLEGKSQIEKALMAGQLKFPFVQKSRTEGYDGRGVAVITGVHDLPKVMDTPSVVETAIDIDKEIAIVAARNHKGEIQCFPAVEMEFNAEANLVEYLMCPAAITKEVSDKCMALATQAIEKLNVVGLLAVELFLDKQGEIWINEAAPRPHNSGHHTIEANATSQYEQHLRAILGFSLGSVQLKSCAVMINLLGAAGHTGPVRYNGLAEAMAVEGASVHLYGKKETKPFRKMGHVTVSAMSVAKALENANQVKNLLTVTA